MSGLSRRFLPRRVTTLASRGLLMIAGWAICSASAWGQGAQSVPPPAYFLTFAGYYDGQYFATDQALLGFLSGAIKNPAAGGFWIDSICYETMRGECCYQMGNHAGAYLHYEAALRLAIRFNNWMLSVQFPPVITPAPPQQLSVVPWYVTQRATVVGNFPPTMNIQQGNIFNNQAVIQGGIVQQAVLMPITVQEIVRCTCLAIRRWRELLGPACPYSEVTRQLVAALALRPALPNHWSEAWIDAELGLAYAAAGKDAQARKTLQNAELVAGQFDHPMTGTILLELGKLDLAGGDFKSAQRNFLEASWAAANFADFGVIEEALRYGALTHAMTKGTEPYLPLAAATPWATTHGLNQLNASLLLSSAENQSMMNQPEAAAALLNTATALTVRTDMLRGKIGARMNHLKSVASYQLGRVDDGNAALAAAMLFQSGGSLWLYQIGLIDVLWNAQDISERVAVDLYANLLRDPSPRDWLVDPLESLSVLAIPHMASYENWFDAALVRKNKEHERALEIADMARRHRFLTTLDEGGRLLNLRWLLEAPPQALDEAAMLQRQAILARYPEYERRSREAKRLRGELHKLPLVPDEKEVADQQEQMLGQLAALSGEQELLLRQISVRREAGNIVFPPLRSFKTVQESLTEGQSLLAFFTTSRYVYAFLIGKDKYFYAEVKPPKNFQRDVTTMLREWGNFEQNKEMKLDELISTKWRKPAQNIMSALVKSSKADFTKTLDELIIVPDGLFWYIPFEALPGDGGEPLIHKVRVRYAPTVGLAVGETRRRKTSGNMAVVLGRLFPRDDANVADMAFEGIARAIPGSAPIRGKLPAPGAIYSSLFDRMIVLNEIAPSTTGYDWSPLQIDNKTPGNTLAQWLSLPFSGPDQVMLPGFRTPAERAMKGGAKDMTGNELFLSVCGLMGGGARTVLISRWRTGGQTSVDLVREFAQELPHTTASDAWQRSVQLVSHIEVNPAAEPRLKPLTPKQSPPTAENPFFWAGYLLADTGALATTDDEEEAAEQVLVAKPAADAKPAEAKPVGGEQDKAGDKEGDKNRAVAKAEKDKPKSDAAADAANADPPPAAKLADDDVAQDSTDKPLAKAKRVRTPRPERKKATPKSKQQAA